MDLIDRQAAIYIASGYCHSANIAKELKKLPSIQPDIIVCAYCKHWVCHDRRCGYWNHGAEPLEWCCHAERRIDEPEVQPEPKWIPCSDCERKCDKWENSKT